MKKGGFKHNSTGYNLKLLLKSLLIMLKNYVNINYANESLLKKFTNTILTFVKCV